MKPTKKDRIIKRLIDGDDPDVIAQEENTSRSYVYKISSANKIKIGRESKKIKNIDQNNADLNPEYMSTKKGLEWTSSLGREDRKKLYRDFYGDLSDEQIIRRYGYDPIIVASERLGYENASRFKPHESQKGLLLALGKPPEEVESIMSRGLLSNSELINIFTSHFQRALNYMQTNYSTNPPPGWSRPKCIACQSYIPGFIYNESEIPHYLALMLKSQCQNCYNCQYAFLRPGYNS
jgi:hypothetical protein